MPLRHAVRARRSLSRAPRNRGTEAGAQSQMRLPGSLSRVPGRIEHADRPSESAVAAKNAKTQVCGRDNTQVSDFPQTYIRKVSIDLGRHINGMRIHWNRQTAETRALPARFDISPGAGLCNLCCNETATSRAEGSLCTPKGDSEINRYACQLASTAWARNVSYFELGDSRNGIAIHSGARGHVPSFPASHGCVRTSNEGSAVVFDNSSARVVREVPDPTEVEVSGTWNGNRCYPSEQGDRRSRTQDERCASRATGALTPQSPQDATRIALEDSATGPGTDDLAGPV